MGSIRNWADHIGGDKSDALRDIENEWIDAEDDW
jgi:hypothetical protein